MVEFSIWLLLIYSLTLWSGLYLLRRNWQKPGMRYAGLGLVAYAVGIALSTWAIPDHLHILVSAVPALFWIFAVRSFIFEGSTDHQPYHPRLLIWIATIFFWLGVGLILLPQQTVPSNLMLILMGLDLLVLGYSMAVLDAYDEGEAMLPDALRSMALTGIGILVFGGQVALAMTMQGSSPALQLLMLGVISNVIVIQVFTLPLQTVLDKLTLSYSPQLQTERAELRAVDAALTRQNTTLDILDLNEQEFTRLTRRALAHLGDLERLAASPLIRLPIIDSRLTLYHRPNSTLARTAELKTLLIEYIEQLKPTSDQDFGTTDEWRYYNALYFPYVLGLKPFSYRQSDEITDSTTQSAARWFREQVPERTLYNWQNKAAQLIARELRESV